MTESVLHTDCARAQLTWPRSTPHGDISTRMSRGVGNERSNGGVLAVQAPRHDESVGSILVCLQAISKDSDGHAENPEWNLGGVQW